MSEKSRWYWGYMCDAGTASRVERAADTLLSGFHHRVNPLIGWMRLDAHRGYSVDLERADEYLSKIHGVLDFIKECSDELTALNFDKNPQVQGVILHIQSVAVNGTFDAMELLKSEAASTQKDEFTAVGSIRVVEALQQTMDYVDIAAGEPAPLRIQIEEVRKERA